MQFTVNKHTATFENRYALEDHIASLGIHQDTASTLGSLTWDIAHVPGCTMVATIGNVTIEAHGLETTAGTTGEDAAVRTG